MRWFNKAVNKEKDMYKNDFNNLDIDSLFADIKANAVKIRRQEITLENIYPMQKPLKEYQSLDRAVKNQLASLALKYNDSNVAKNKLSNRLVKNNPALTRIETYENQLPFLKDELQNASTLATKYKTNIDYLKAEKDHLVIDRESLLLGYNALEKLGMFFLVLLGISLIMTFTLMQVIRESVWIHMSLISITFMIFVLFLVLSKEKLERELTRNEVLQKKASKYIQKFQIHYFTQQQYLEYQYKKLGVNTPEQLDSYVSKYMKNKDYERNYQQYLKSSQDSEQKIKDTLQINDVPIKYINTIEYWIINPNKLKEVKKMVSEISSMQKSIEDMKEYEQELYKALLSYNSKSEYDEYIKDKLTEYYKWVSERLELEAQD
ncbi:MAG: hypothetical protein ATN31_08265 [Candidatus Epulonipiscioides saccharophilum]|nr:MAG: hypothetical protein ATN31_08265 [Epulopiscium sp. AS2M-Bin001]